MKTVLITGAGGGLGKAMAKKFHEEGNQVIVTDTSVDILSEYTDKQRFSVHKLDVTSEIDCKQVTNDIAVKFDKIYVLISNAGIFDFYSLTGAGSEKLNKMFSVNVFGLANLTKYFLPLLLKSRGRLIVISSESYKVPSPFQPYAVSKQALEKLFDAVRLELLAKGIVSVLIRPGAIQTQILENTINYNDTENEKLFQKEFSRFLFSVKKYIGKVAAPEEVAGLIYKAAISKKPKKVYSINHNPLVTLLSILPNRMKERFVLKSLTKN